MNAIMGIWILNTFLTETSSIRAPKSVKRIRLADNQGFSLIKELLRPAHVLTDSRFSTGVYIAFPELPHSPPRYLHIQNNPFCRYPLLFLSNIPMNLALVQLYNPCYGLGPKRVRNTFGTLQWVSGVGNLFIVDGRK